VLQDSQVLGSAVTHAAPEPSRSAEGATAHDEGARCRAAMESRQQLGVATGLTAALTHSTPDEAWALLLTVSRNANIKVREVGRVVVQAYCGDLGSSDRALADRIRPHLPKGSRLLPPGARRTGS
jgi:hypothetical protein